MTARPLSCLRAAALAIGLLGLSSHGPALAQVQPPSAANPGEDGGVAVPNFWDPRGRLERPVAETLPPIRFLVTDDFPPFAFRDRRGALIGFNIDLAEAVCRVLKAACAVQVRPFDTLTAGLQEGAGNAILAGFDPEKSTDRGFIATQAYLKIPARFVAPAGGSFDPAAPPLGRFVGVACGGAHQAFVERYFPAMKIACYTSAANALSEMQAGHLAAVFGDALGLAYWLQGDAAANCCAFAGGPYLDDRFFGAGLSIVLRQEDRPLKLALDYALREVQRSGTYEELYLRYFPISLY